MGTKSNRDHSAVAEAYLAGGTLRSVAALFGIPKSTVVHSLKLTGTPFRSKQQVYANKYGSEPWRDRDTMRRLYVDEKQSTLQLAERFGCDRSTVTDWLNRHGIETRTTAETQLGKSPPSKGRGRKNDNSTVLCGCGCGRSIRRFNQSSGERFFINGHQHRGERNRNWKGGNTESAIRTRRTPAYRDWHREVLQQSAFTCQCCGKVGGKLEAHHLDNYADHPDRRFDTSNGVALCRGCHRGFHKIYGHQRKTTADQFLEYQEKMRCQ